MPHTVTHLLSVCLSLTCLSATVQAEAVLIEAESFQRFGGWVVDQQSMDVMGSPYLLAHGLGQPVADAKTTVPIPKPGTYRVLIRTRDWVATWAHGGAGQVPGRDQWKGTAGRIRH